VTSLGGRVAFVTGAARGIGRAIALGLADAGAAVAVADLHPEPFRGEAYHRLRERWSGPEEEISTADEVAARGCRSIALEVDVAEPDSVRSAVESCGRELRVNLSGAFHCVQATVPSMAARGWGRVVNISSVAARVPGLGQPAYAASKAAVVAFTQSVAQEFGRSGVTANAVLPGLIGTPLVRSMPEALRERIVAQTSVGRLGEPAEIAALVAFLASPAAGFLTAAAIPCDGGFLGAPVFGLTD
jgi:NAD(P)-dependent dehydrogenase (short-subunit alcohol dehydrogenase family)